jgi:tight adherence protein C
MLLLVLGVVSIGVAFGLLVHALALPRLRAAQRLSQIDDYGYPAAAQDKPAPGASAAGLDRLAERIGAAAMARFGEGDAGPRRLLLSAGIYGLGAEAFLGYRLLATLALPLAWLWLGVTLGAPAAVVAIGAPVCALLGWRLPLVVVQNRAERRLTEIDYELPELVDSLVVTVEAGSGFDSALRMASQELSGPLGEEIALTLREQGMGRSSEEALEGMAARIDTPAMRAFVRAVLQGDRLGVSIGDIMRSLAAEARARRRSSAEERAHRAPVKLLFPLVLLIFPSILIVLLYPAIHNVTEALGGG